MDSKCFLTSTDLQTRRARCQHQLSFLLDTIPQCDRSATPLHIAQCVARFVSDSWVSCTNPVYVRPSVCLSVCLSVCPFVTLWYCI